MTPGPQTEFFPPHQPRIVRRVRIAVLGAAGRMGRALVEVLSHYQTPSMPTVQGEEAKNVYPFNLVAGIEKAANIPPAKVFYTQNSQNSQNSPLSSAEPPTPTPTPTPNVSPTCLGDITGLATPRAPYQYVPLVSDFSALSAHPTYHLPLKQQHNPPSHKEVPSIDVVIDFSHPHATLTHLPAARQHNISAWVIGTTGYSPHQEQQLRNHASHTVIVRSGNFSRGIYTLNSLLKHILSFLDSSYDIEIVETHHHRKKDAPSGTAKMLAQTIVANKNLDYSSTVHCGRHGENALRHKGEIGISAVRGGGAVGDHQVLFIGEDEQLSFTHTAFNRQAFTSAIPQAIFFAHHHAQRNKFGIYNLEQVLTWQSKENTVEHR